MAALGQPGSSRLARSGRERLDSFAGSELSVGAQALPQLKRAASGEGEGEAEAEGEAEEAEEGEGDGEVEEEEDEEDFNDYVAGEDIDEDDVDDDGGGGGGGKDGEY